MNYEGTLYKETADGAFRYNGPHVDEQGNSVAQARDPERR